MIITCNNCNKNFNLDSNLIPDKGRLLQCASCDHKWFYKTALSPIEGDKNNVNIFDQNNTTDNIEINPSDPPKEEVKVDNEKELEKKIEVNKNERIPVTTKAKKQKAFKKFNIIIVAIISFVAFIIIIDTFKYPIGKVVPSVEFILYNLYESIIDISLFIKDLI